jgi:hypothetical protein
MPLSFPLRGKVSGMQPIGGFRLSRSLPIAPGEGTRSWADASGINTYMRGLGVRLVLGSNRTRKDARLQRGAAARTVMRYLATSNQILGRG